jgi:hypothetical protein
MIEYSIGLVSGYAIAKYLTPKVSSIIIGKYHIHHWIWSFAILLILLNVETFDGLIGFATGICLEGLSYKNWSIKSKEAKKNE